MRQFERILKSFENVDPTSRRATIFEDVMREKKFKFTLVFSNPPWTPQKIGFACPSVHLGNGIDPFQVTLSSGHQVLPIALLFANSIAQRKAPIILSFRDEDEISTADVVEAMQRMLQNLPGCSPDIKRKRSPENILFTEPRSWESLAAPLIRTDGKMNVGVCDSELVPPRSCTPQT